MGKHSRRGGMSSRVWGIVIGTTAVVGIAATAGVATTGGFGFTGSTDTPAEGGSYRVTVKDGHLDSLVFVPSASSTPSATASQTPPVLSPSPSQTPPVLSPSATKSPSATAKPSTSAPKPSATVKPSRSPSGTPAPTSPASPAPSSTAPPATTGAWLSGLSGEGDTDGRFAAWRGSPVEIVGTWADADEANQRRVYTVTGGSGTFSGPIDVGVGAIVRGESWSQAAAGAYDARWRESLGVMAQARKGKGTTYIRFAHEMNGNWYPWSVNSGNVADFKKAWARYRALQQQIFPEAKLVFSANRNSVGAGMDWRQMFPGAGQVDIMSVDYYNFGGVKTAQQWASDSMAVDSYGAPIGIEQHRRFAASVGLPLAVSEWSGRAAEGDNPEFMTQMHAFFAKNGGTSAGNLLYEILFNVSGYEGNYQLFPATNQPTSAARYRDLF